MKNYVIYENTEHEKTYKHTMIHDGNLRTVYNLDELYFFLSKKHMTSTIIILNWKELDE